MENSQRLKQLIDQWVDKSCIDPHTELICKSIQMMLEELERSNFLLVELINRTK